MNFRIPLHRFRPAFSRQSGNLPPTAARLSSLRTPLLERSTSGVALVIVLAFIVLMSGLVVAFFSRSVNETKLATSSASDSKVRLFADGAANVVIGDLMKEIEKGSKTPVDLGNGKSLYLPSTPADMVPKAVGSSRTNGVENLVKRSANGQAFYTGGPTRASSVPTTAVSLNGRSVTKARWNSPLFMKKATSTSDSNLTPVNEFTVPDWILVKRDGAEHTGGFTAAVKTSTADTGTVIGRYAYAIYDEGGVLDINVAGYSPSATSAAGASGAKMVASKTSVAYADLTTIPGISDLPTSGSGLTQEKVSDNILGFRNFVTASTDWTKSPPAQSSDLIGGALTKYTFAKGVAANYHKFLLADTSGGMTSGSSYLRLSPRASSDNKFISRQQLIKWFLSGIAAHKNTAADIKERASLQNALPYFTHFSRALNQPSFTPNPDRPDIVAGNGGNDAKGGDDVINPSFAETRVKTGFTRNDGTTASVGEALVKKRFALNRLAWITYNGPSSTRTVPTTEPAATSDNYDMWVLVDSGITPSFLKQGTAAEIKKYFGLTWNSSTKNWTYTSPTGSTGSPIKTLSGISGREPDFFELLKAGVGVGSLAKAYAAPGAPLTPEGYQQQIDFSVDAQLMRMGANIIDQFDADGYPTRIVFNDGSLFGGKNLEYRGVEDLPYLYRVREAKVMTKSPVPPMESLPIADGVTLAPTVAGEGVYLLQPEIWNPHALVDAAAERPRPTQFRILAATMDPVTETPTNYRLGAQWRPDNGSNFTWQSTASQALNETMSFNIPSGRLNLFREPTMLNRPGIPSGSNLAGPASYKLDSVLENAWVYSVNNVSGVTEFTGFPIGKVPMAFSATFAAGGINNSSTPVIPAATTAGVAPTGWTYYPTSGNTTSYPYVTYRLQCNVGGQWVTYDEKYASAPANSSFNAPGRWSEDEPGTPRFKYAGNKTFFRLEQEASSVGAAGSENQVAAFDPRTSRFGMIFSGPNARGNLQATVPLSSMVRYFYDENRVPWSRFGWAGAPAKAANATMTAAAQHNAVMTMRPDEYLGVPFSGGQFTDNSGPTAAGWLPVGASGVISPGMMTQNSVSATGNILRTAVDTAGSNSTVPSYFADPDGVVRRGMSAYVPAGGGAPAAPPASGQPSGLPMKTAYEYTSGSPKPSSTNDVYSRPMILNRPFQTVAELGYVFSDTPWRNLDVTTPESGAVALLDTFCIGESDNADALMAGKVNLNTRQAPVLKAIIAGAYRDPLNPVGSTVAPVVDSAVAQSIADALVARTAKTSATEGPLANVSELVGRWNSAVSSAGAVDGSKSYVGFAADGLTSALTSDTDKRVQSFRAAAIRALANAGQTRVWNLMIDLVAQTGRYPISASGLNDFLVEGEQRLWVHLAIDRLTGEVIDKQIEVVTE